MAGASETDVDNHGPKAIFESRQADPVTTYSVDVDVIAFQLGSDNIVYENSPAPQGAFFSELRLSNKSTDDLWS